VIQISAHLQELFGQIFTQLEAQVKTATADCFFFLSFTIVGQCCKLRG